MTVKRKSTPKFFNHEAAVQILVSKIRRALPKSWSCDDPYLEDWQRVAFGQCYKIRARPAPCPCCGHYEDLDNYVSMILGDNAQFAIQHQSRMVIRDVTRKGNVAKIIADIKKCVKAEIKEIKRIKAINDEEEDDV